MTGRDLLALPAAAYLAWLAIDPARAVQVTGVAFGLLLIAGSLVALMWALLWMDARFVIEGEDDGDPF